MTFISYAQAKEDIHLLRALKGVGHDVGFYIDVGAWDPEIDSVTKLFYDAGWHGVNIEPSPKWFARFIDQRPRDINIQAAISDTTGQVTFYEHLEGGLSTMVEQIADNHKANGYMEKRKLDVQALTLTQVCDKYAPREIHFLKIDVEGGEGRVLRGMNFERYRPWILCIESHFPLRTDVQVYEEWEGYVTGNRYRFVFTDKINRYYIAAEHEDRAASFLFPSDFYAHINDVRRARELEDRIRVLEEKLTRIKEISEVSVS